MKAAGKSPEDAWKTPKSAALEDLDDQVSSGRAVPVLGVGRPEKGDAADAEGVREMRGRSVNYEHIEAARALRKSTTASKTRGAVDHAMSRRDQCTT